MSYLNRNQNPMSSSWSYILRFCWKCASLRARASLIEAKLARLVTKHHFKIRKKITSLYFILYGKCSRFHQFWYHWLFKIISCTICFLVALTLSPFVMYSAILWVAVNNTLSNEDNPVCVKRIINTIHQVGSHGISRRESKEPFASAEGW